VDNRPAGASLARNLLQTIVNNHSALKRIAQISSCEGIFDAHSRYS
jgi:hypothetical protein